MKLYTDPSQVDRYEKMCTDYDGSALYQVLSRHLKEKSTLLELGCGPGNDITHLQGKYVITGSDLSDEFLIRCEKRFKHIPFIKLDAVSINTNQKFDCVFSNKVLHHLKIDQLERSFKRQQDVIKRNGLFAHTFWIGEKEFIMEDMLFVYHNRKRLLNLVSRYFTVLETYGYKEFEDEDSVFILAHNNLQD